MDLLRGLAGALMVFYAFGLATAQGSAGIGPHLQDQFRVGKLPNVTWSIAGCQYAGNLPVQRGTNLSLFFWGVESKQGSLTAPAGKSDAPWIIWLQGYVACSVLVNSASTSSLPRLTRFSFTVDPGPRPWPVFFTRYAHPDLPTSPLTRLTRADRFG